MKKRSGFSFDNRVAPNKSGAELRQDFDQLVARMESPEAAAVAKKLFAMSDVDLRRALRNHVEPRS